MSTPPMNCAEFRRALGADPNYSSAAATSHLATCDSCQRFAAENVKLNALIKRALDIPVPQQQSVMTPIEVQTHRFQPRWYAMAASALLTIGIIAFVLSVGTPRDSLANDVLKHMDHEPEAMQMTNDRVAFDALNGVLRAKGLHLSAPMSNVSYLQECEIREHIVPHFVVQTDQGPVTVLLLADETVSATQRLEEGRYRGVLVPAPKGGIAVIGSDEKSAKQVADRVIQQIAWQ